MSETKNLLTWRLNTKQTPSVWMATGLAGIKYNVLLGETAEGLIILPGGQVFIAAIEDTVCPIDDIKVYLQADHDSRCAVRDLSAHLGLQIGKQSKTSTKRIILPGSQS